MKIKMKKVKVKVGGMSISTPKLPRNHYKYHQLPYSPSQHNEKPLLMGASELSDGNSKAGKVPKGFVAVYVGPNFRRFLVPISFLTIPDLKVLMDDVAEEFGCDVHADGALQIPTCDEDHFERVLMACFARKRMELSSKKRHKIIKHSKIPTISTH